VGINAATTAAIVDATGTVIARTFLTCGRHNDRRDAPAATIAQKRSLSGTVRRGERHCSALLCSALHRRIAGYGLDAARTLASELAAFAAKFGAKFGAKAFVIEDLKGWRPRGPSKAMRKRFHRFEHRALVAALAHQAQELGPRLLEVFARGTSRWAYDGSGKVSRSRQNAQLATFASGKRYNADLNGALNIAARGLAMLVHQGAQHRTTGSGRQTFRSCRENASGPRGPLGSRPDAAGHLSPPGLGLRRILDFGPQMPQSQSHRDLAAGVFTGAAAQSPLIQSRQQIGATLTLWYEC
jgi:putative transposase